MNAQIKTNFYLAIIALLLISCATTEEQVDFEKFPTPDTEPTEVEVPMDDPEALVRLGKDHEAAMLYLTIASKTTSPQRQTLQLKGINLLIKQKAYDAANNLLSEISPAELNTQQLAHYAYLNAKITVNERSAEQSLQWLEYFESEEYGRFTSEKDALELIIAIYDLAGKTQAATLTRLKLEPLLSDEAETLSNQQAIIRGLLLLNEEELSELSNKEQSGSKLAWFELASIVKKSNNPFRLGNQLASWRELNPHLHIRDEIIASLAPQQTDEQLSIENIALLLPLSGPYKKPASAVRDGFMANYYADDTAEGKPVIRIYNTSDKQKSITDIYQTAINEGADIIVGPLRKKSVEVLTKNVKVNVPTLVLNQLENQDFYAKDFYQFALSPEQEAQQTAQRAWQDGHNRAAVIFPDNKWGMRVATAFKEEWQLLGGEIVAESGYKPKKNDFSKPIKTLLAIDKSHKRKQELAKLFRTKLRFEARRRQDIDFIFMAAFPRQARLIPPQFDFFHASTLPIYSTSHSFSGKINRKKDRDLNSLIVGDMPWTLTTTKNNNTKLQIYRTWPNKSKQFNRFYAFGNDAYFILNYLNWLRANSQSRLMGQTGKLHMNEHNQILRELSWAKFKKGKPRLLPATARISN